MRNMKTFRSDENQIKNKTKTTQSADKKRNVKKKKPAKKIYRTNAKKDTGKTLYVLDEPTTGLHFADVHKLIDILKRLTESGNTVVVIEHNLDVIKTADYIIDIGPEGGDRGGTVIAAGTPEDVADTKGSYTGEFLKKILV